MIIMLLQEQFDLMYMIYKLSFHKSHRIKVAKTRHNLSIIDIGAEDLLYKLHSPCERLLKTRESQKAELR